STSNTTKLTYLVSGSADTQIRIWNLSSTSPEPIQILQHNSGVRSLLATNSTGTSPRLFSGGLDGTIIEWNITTLLNQPPILQTISAHNDLVYSITMLNSTLISAGYDKMVKLFDVSNPLSVIPRKTMQYSTTMEVVYALPPTTLYVGGDDLTVSQWDISKDLVERKYSGATRSVINVAVDTINGLLYSSSLDGVVREYDAASGSLRRTFVGNGTILTMVLASGKLYSAGSDGMIREWDLGTVNSTTPRRVFVH
ncbi:hypothetical protein HK096_001143, partial [Nowakowskiella sp. JEL0078]